MLYPEETSWFPSLSSFVPICRGMGKKKEEKKKKVLYLHEGRAGIEWSIQFCQGSHSLLWHQYSAKIVTLWYLLYCEVGDFLRLGSFRSMGLQCGSMKPDGKDSPRTTAWKSLASSLWAESLQWKEWQGRGEAMNVV